jgi:predicted RNase H-like HicB family nuclease
MKKNIVKVSFKGKDFFAHAPGLPGCFSTGNTPTEIKKNIAEAIDFHLAGMREDGDPIPESFQGNYELAYKFSPKALLKYEKAARR